MLFDSYTIGKAVLLLNINLAEKMTLFLSILFILLAINAILLIFSVNGAGERLRKPIRKISETSLPRLFPREASETEYKEAV